MNFSQWIERELKERGWSRLEAARRGHVSASMLDKVINGNAKPGLKFLDGLAKTFKLSPAEVYRAAGYLPPASKEDRLIEDIKDILEELPEEEREAAYEYIRMRRRVVEEKEAKYNAKSKTRPANG